MRIHFALADNFREYNTSLWRCMIPAMALKERGHDVTASHYSDLDVNEHFDAVISERNLFDADLVRDLNTLSRRGVRVLFTFDDAYHLMVDCVSKPTWSPDNLMRFTRALRIPDVVMVPNRVLANDFARYCRYMTYVPNYYDASLFEGLKRHTQHGHGFNIVWGGNMTHTESLEHSGVLQALQRLCQESRHVNVHAVGNPAITAIFRRFIPAGQLYQHPWMSLTEWPELLAQVADVGVAPLAGEYDRRRSWVKAVDFSLLGIPLVASPLEPYQDLKGVIKLPDNTPDDWYYALSNMARTKRGYKLALEQAQVARTEMLQLSIQKNVQLYEELCYPTALSSPAMDSEASTSCPNSCP